MAKGHRDNHAARRKRGAVAFAKKAKRRRRPAPRCRVCGSETRMVKLTDDVCPACLVQGGYY